MPAIDDVAPVERVRQNLKDRSRNRVPLIDLPEERRPSAILEIVIVVDRPDSIASSTQDAAPDDPEAEPKEHVQVVAPDRLKFILGNPVREALAQRMHRDRRNTSEQSGEISGGLRIRLCLVATVVPLLIPVIPRHLPMISQTLRERNLCLRNRRSIQNNKFDLCESGCLDVFYDSGNPCA